MNYKDTKQQIDLHYAEIRELRKKVRELQETREGEPVEDYTLSTPKGKVKLSELFGEHNTLFMVHNMGRSCKYCTLWADGFNGVFEHLQNRGAFVVSSPDSPKVQKEFAESRHWRMPMASHEGTSFAEDMGYKTEQGWHPGLSVFRKDNQGIVRVSDTGLGPYDDFCLVWHLFALTPEGAAGWEPKFTYN